MEKKIYLNCIVLLNLELEYFGRNGLLLDVKNYICDNNIQLPLTLNNNSENVIGQTGLLYLENGRICTTIYLKEDKPQYLYLIPVLECYLEGSNIDKIIKFKLSLVKENKYYKTPSLGQQQESIDIVNTNCYTTPIISKDSEKSESKFLPSLPKVWIPIFGIIYVIENKAEEQAYFLKIIYHILCIVSLLLLIQTIINNYYNVISI